MEGQNLVLFFSCGHMPFLDWNHIGKERERETERQRDRDRQREREREGEMR